MKAILSNLGVVELEGDLNLDGEGNLEASGGITGARCWIVKVERIGEYF